MSSHGCAARAAEMIRTGIPGSEMVTLEDDQNPDLSGYDLIVLGGSIRIGSLQKRLKKFMEKNLTLLLAKKIGLYICCMYEGEKAMQQLRRNFPDSLTGHASALGLFGGELDFGVMNAMETMIIRDIIGISENVSLFREEKVREFVSRLMEALRA